MPQVVLIRPGCTDFDQQCRIQGSIELPLNEHGQEQVRSLVAQLQELPLEVIYTAPGRPARCTAEAVAAELGVPVKVKDELRNVNLGLWEGLQLDEIRFKYPKVYRQWEETPETICPPQGESVSDAIARVRKVLRKPMKRKACFAVVLAEPLATLVQCDLSGRKLEIPEPADVGCRITRIDVLEPGDEHPGSELDTLELDAFAHPRGAASAQNGSTQNGHAGRNGAAVAAARQESRGEHSG